MLRRWPFFRLALVASVAWGCGTAGPSQQSPTRLAPLPERLPTARRQVTVLVRYDGELARSADAEARLRRRVEAAGQQLHLAAGLAVTIQGFQPWPAPRSRTTEGLLADLEATDPPPGVDLVIGFTASPLPRRIRTADVVRSRYAGRHVAVRTLAELFPRDLQALHDAETLLVMHGVARIFGALPACSPAIMAPNLGFGLGPAAWRLAPVNAALLQAHLNLDLQRADGRVSADTATAALALLTPTPHALSCEAPAVERRRRVLAAVIGQPPAPAEIPAAPPPEDPEIQAGLAALDAGDDASALARCAPVAERDPTSPASRCAGVAAAGLGDRPAAIRYLRAHLAHQPNDGQATLLLAKQIGREGDDAGARALLARFVRGNPDHLEARVNLGVAHARLGDLEAARAAWQAVVDRDPAHADARQLLDQLPAP